MDVTVLRALKRLRQWSHVDVILYEIGAPAEGREGAIRHNVLPRLVAQGYAKRQPGGFYRYREGA